MSADKEEVEILNGTAVWSYKAGKNEITTKVVVKDGFLPFRSMNPTTRSK